MPPMKTKNQPLPETVEPALDHATGEVDEEPVQKRFTYSSELPVILSHEEKIAMSQQIAREYDLMTMAEDRKKEAASQHKAEIEGHQSNMRRISGLINSGVEHRQVECEDIYDYVEKTVTTVRLDTMDMVRIRGMKQHELQTSFNLGADDYKREPEAERGSGEQAERDDSREEVSSGKSDMGEDPE